MLYLKKARYRMLRLIAEQIGVHAHGKYVMDEEAMHHMGIGEKVTTMSPGSHFASVEGLKLDDRRQIQCPQINASLCERGG